MEFLRKKKIRLSCILLILLITYIILSLIVEFDLFFYTKLPGGFVELLEKYFPPKFEELSSLNILFKGALETLFMSISSTVVGSLFAFLLTLLSINNWKYNIFAVIAKVTSSFARNIPPYIWGVLLIYILWYGPYIAYIALSIATFGFLIRVFNEVIENTGKDGIEALKATGASNWQIIMRAILPESKQLIFSWMLYAFELNIRSATIVSLVTRSGLGGLLQNSMDASIISYPDKHHYQMAIILVIGLLVITSDIFVSKIRRRLLGWS